MAKDFKLEIKPAQLKSLFNKLDSTTRSDVIKRSLDLSARHLAGWSKRNRLTGARPRFLGVVTGRLRSSISSTRPEKTQTGWKVRIGTNVKYGRIHELGFRGRVTVGAHLRKTRGRTSSVRGHTRFMNMPARPFLRPAIEERQNHIKILNIFTENINRAIQRTT